MQPVKFAPVFIGAMLFLLFPDIVRARDDKTLLVDVRQRPPEMTVEAETVSGPLIDIITEAAQRTGYAVKFQVRQFQGSLRYLECGLIDILPRAICTPARTKTMEYLGPIGYEPKEILFLVKPGQENSIQTFDDLKRLTVGVKQGTVYFEEFDANQEIVKIESDDDENLVRMFVRNRFETMIILDKHAVEAALDKYQITGYAYAHYRYPVHLAIYYGIRQGHPAQDALQQALEAMVASGRIKAIYAQYHLDAPLFDPQQGFEPCLQK